MRRRLCPSRLIHANLTSWPSRNFTGHAPPLPEVTALGRLRVGQDPFGRERPPTGGVSGARGSPLGPPPPPDLSSRRSHGGEHGRENCREEPQTRAFPAWRWYVSRSRGVDQGVPEGSYPNGHEPKTKIAVLGTGDVGVAAAQLRRLRRRVQILLGTGRRAISR
jgi:hypothetical protein